jgi:hypothetical protein
MKLMKTEDYHEDFGNVIFIAWGRDNNDHILGEPPELHFGQGYLEDDFDGRYFTHWIEAKFFNDLFHQVDPENFPKK